MLTAGAEIGVVIGGLMVAAGGLTMLLRRVEAWLDARYVRHDRTPLTADQLKVWRAYRRELADWAEDVENDVHGGAA